MAVAARKPDNENEYVSARASTMRVYTHRPEPRTQQQEEPQREAVPCKSPAPAAGLAKKLLATVGILASAAVMLMVLVRYAVIAEQYALVNEYKQNIVENDRMLQELEVRLNSAVSLDEAREAALAAGLGYPSASQIIKIDGSKAGGDLSSSR